MTSKKDAKTSADKKKDSKMSADKQKSSSLIKTYLFLYNFVQVLGWSYLLLQIYSHFQNAEHDLYESVKWPLIIFQNAAALEIFHATSGLVKSNPAITTFQVLSRVMVVCGVLMPTVGGRAFPGLPLCLLAWSITEIIRYLYYAMNILNYVPHILVWLRYTTFIILYPVGVTGELLCLYGAQNEVAETKMWSLELPNRINFAFNYRYFLICVMLLYGPLFPKMFLHMVAQRRKILGGQKKKVA